MFYCPVYLKILCICEHYVVCKMNPYELFILNIWYYIKTNYFIEDNKFARFQEYSVPQFKPSRMARTPPPVSTVVIRVCWLVQPNSSTSDIWM